MPKIIENTPETIVPQQGNIFSKAKDSLLGLGKWAKDKLNGADQHLRNFDQDTQEVGSLGSEQNKQAWYSVDTELAKKIEQMSDAEKEKFDELRGELQAFNTPVLSPLYDNLKGAPVTGAGRDRVVDVLMKFTGDLDGIAAVAPIGQNVFGKMVSGVQQFFGDVVKDVGEIWNDPDKQLLEKVTGTVGTAFSHLGNSLSGMLKGITSPKEGLEGSVKDVLIERSKLVRTELKSMGFDDRFANFMQKKVLTEGQKTVEDKVGFKLGMSRDDIASIVQESSQYDNVAKSDTKNTFRNIDTTDIARVSNAYDVNPSEVTGPVVTPSNKEAPALAGVTI